MRVSLDARNLACTTLTRGTRKTKGATQVNFTGNVTALRQHIRRMGGEHYEVYRKHCATNGIDVHPTAVPDDIKNSSGSPRGEQQLITNFVEVRPKGFEWNQDELLDLVVRFVVETDQVIDGSSMRRYSPKTLTFADTFVVNPDY